MLLLLASQVCAATTIEIRIDDDLVALHAVDARIRDILEALVKSGLLNIDSALALDDRVTLTTSPEPLAALLRRLLRSHSYELYASASQHRASRLAIFSATEPPTRAWQARSSASPIDQALADLSNPDPDIREEAILTLSDLRDPATAAYLMSSLNDESGDVREAVSAALEDLETTDFAPPGRLRKRDID